MPWFKILLIYLRDLFVFNEEGWHVGYGAPSADAQMFRIRMNKKPYSERTCVMCKRDFWSYKKTDVCFRAECFFKYMRKEVTCR